ncbi:MAG TPA: RNA methyltransferase [Syntrophales bacterium]|nr:RNA methyltransferase [Syntrophales bacterium]HPO34582.1 RNA methyltransferase [Syntrophales bacterium]
MVPSHNQLKRWAKLLDGKYRHREQAFLAEGEKVVAQLLAAHWPVECFLVREDRADTWLPKETPCYILKPKEFQKLSQDKEPEGIMAVAKRYFPTEMEISRQERYLLLHEISNPNNLGAILRTAHWFGLYNIIVSDNSVDITHPKVVRASMGSLFHLKVAEKQDISVMIHKLRAQGIRTIATDAASGKPPESVAPGVAILFGNETHGLPEAVKSLCDECWHIPGTGGIGSLSLPQAVAIVLYELTRRDFHETR